MSRYSSRSRRAIGSCRDLFHRILLDWNTTGFGFDLLNFKNNALYHKLSGLWVGVSLGLFVSLTLSLLHMSRLDLNRLVERAKRRCSRDACQALLDDVAGEGGGDDELSVSSE